MDKEQYFKFIKRKIYNCLKGECTLIVDENNSMSTPLEKCEKMSVIGDFLKYIEVFEYIDKEEEHEKKINERFKRVNEK